LIAVLGHDLVRLDRLTDAAHCLRLREAQQIVEMLDDFERQFPQVFVAIYLGVLPQSLSLKELSFWLLNQAAFNTKRSHCLNEYAVALLVDPVAKNVGLNLGYALEECLPVGFLERTLRAMRTPLWHGEYVTAVRLILKRISSRLRKTARRVPQPRDLGAPENTEAFLDASGLQLLRKSSAASRAPLDMVSKVEDNDSSEDAVQL
jgi:uncharacterized membrane protein YgcG